jgi:hypothetical protein
VDWTITNYTKQLTSFRIQGFSGTTSRSPGTYGPGTYRDIICFPSASTAFFVNSSSAAGSVDDITIRSVVPILVDYRPRRIAVVGDSIAQQQAVNYRPVYSSYANYPNGLRLPLAEISPIDCALGNTTWQWAESNGVPRAILTGAPTIILHCGVNDIDAARPWDQVLTNLTNIRSLVTTQDLFLSELIPWTQGDDTEAATLRQWNTNYAAWAATNSVVFMSGHNALIGTNRPSTGFLDDINPTLNDESDVHVTQGGIDIIWYSWLTALTNNYGSPLK